MDGSQAEPQSSPSLLSVEGKHPPPSSVHSPQRQQQPFGFFPLCRRKQGQEEEKRHHSEGSCCSVRMRKGCMSSPQDGALLAPWMTAGVGNTKPGLLLFCCSPALCSIPWSGRGQAAPWAPLSCLIPPWLSLQLGLGASDLHPSSPKTSSSTKPSPRQWRKRNPPNAALHLVCAVLRVPSRRRAARFRSRCRSSPPTSLLFCNASFWTVFLPFKEKTATAGGGMAGHFLHYSPLECLKLDFKYNT